MFRGLYFTFLTTDATSEATLLYAEELVARMGGGVRPNKAYTELGTNYVLVDPSVPGVKLATQIRTPLLTVAWLEHCALAGHYLRPRAESGHIFIPEGFCGPCSCVMDADFLENAPLIRDTVSSGGVLDDKFLQDRAEVQEREEAGRDEKELEKKGGELGTTCSEQITLGATLKRSREFSQHEPFPKEIKYSSPPDTASNPDGQLPSVKNSSFEISSSYAGLWGGVSNEGPPSLQDSLLLFNNPSVAAKPPPESLSIYFSASTGTCGGGAGGLDSNANSTSSTARLSSLGTGGMAASLATGNFACLSIPIECTEKALSLRDSSFATTSTAVPSLPAPASFVISAPSVSVAHITRVNVWERSQASTPPTFEMAQRAQCSSEREGCEEVSRDLEVAPHGAQIFEEQCHDAPPFVESGCSDDTTAPIGEENLISNSSNAQAQSHHDQSPIAPLQVSSSQNSKTNSCQAESQCSSGTEWCEIEEGPGLWANVTRTTTFSQIL